MKRSHYADMCGPTTGDKVRVGGTSLILQVEKDFTVYRDKWKFGGGNNLASGKVSGVGRKTTLKPVKQKGFANT